MQQNKQNKSNIISIIPARGGSKGVPGKNIKSLGGHPLIAYSIVASKMCPSIGRTIVSTDSKEIADIARQYGADVPFLRPAEFAGDQSTDYDVVLHTLNWLSENERSHPELLVYLRPTTPFREITYIYLAIEQMKNNTDATALRSAHEMPQSSYKTLEIENGYFKCICSGSFKLDAVNLPRQEYQTTYDANGYVDILRPSFILENNSLFGDQVFAYVTPRIAEVDTLDDFAYLEYQVSKTPGLVTRLIGKREL